MAAVGKLPPLCRVITDVYREAVEDEVKGVGKRLTQAVEGCLQVQPAGLTPEQVLTQFTRCLSSKVRR